MQAALAGFPLDRLLDVVPRVVLFEPASGTWLAFSSPVRVLTTSRIEDVLPLVREMEAVVARDGVFAAGFISYEAAPAFDACLPAKATGDFPLLWFGLFRNVTELETFPAGRDVNLPASWQPSVSDAEYRRCLDAIHTHIHDGDAYQVNFTYRLHAQTDVAPWDFFVRLVGDERTPHAAFVDTGEWAVCSASPELFLRLDGARLESQPMKGTAARGLWFEDDCARADALRASEKDRAENVMIVDMVRNDLGRVAVAGSVQAPSLFDVARFPTVWQMTSTVCAETHASLAEILQATFPPASITGAPKRRAMEIIAALESSPRRVYTGAIGFVAPGRRAQFSVAIRTVLLHHASGEAEYGVGGGIVWDSKPAAERQECVTKTKALHPLRRDFDLLETMLGSPGGPCRLLAFHLARLAQSAEFFGFSVDFDKIRDELEKCARSLSGYARIRLLVSRRGAFRCEAKDVEPAALRFDDIALAATPVDAGDVFLYHKTTNRMVYENAMRAQPNHSDVLLFNEDGEITESTIANVAVEMDGVLCTPPVRCGLLPGTLRAAMLARGELCERVVTVEQARRAAAVYLLNSVRGMHPVRIIPA
jgi:para-aminobenzoate synthetase/4-amino-4-deoxychorismate lyase